MGGFRTAFSAYVAAALVVVVLAFATAGVLAAARKAVAERVAAAAPKVKRWGGVLQLVVGGWLILLAIFAPSFARLFRGPHLAP